MLVCVWVPVCLCVCVCVCVCANICKAQTSNTKTELAALYINQIETPTLRNHKQNKASMITSSSDHKKPNRPTRIQTCTPTPTPQQSTEIIQEQRGEVSVHDGYGDS